MMKVIFCTLMGLRVGCRISGLSREFPLFTNCECFIRASSTATPKKERMHLQMDSIITTWLLLFAVKENPHWVSEVYRFPILARKCHKWPSFWLKPEEECSQARTCPLWKVAPGKSVGLFALQCYQWCGEFMRVLHACLNSTSLIPLITQIPRILHVYKQLIQILLVLLHLEMKLEECWDLDSEDI